MLFDTVRRRGASRRGASRRGTSRRGTSRRGTSRAAVLPAASSRMRGTRGATARRSRSSPLPNVPRNH